MQAATFFTDGGSWFCYKTGGLIGESVSWDGGGIPPGYLYQDGSAFDSNAYQELYQLLGTNVLRDKRDRVEIGAGLSYGLGGAYGATSVTLGTANLPPYTPSGSVGVGASGSVDLPFNAGHGYNAGGGIVAYQRSTGNVNDSKAVTVNITSTSFTGNAQGGASAAFGIIQPSIGTYKIIRAC
jgi:microcystin-dependent protein